MKNQRNQWILAVGLGGLGALVLVGLAKKWNVFPQSIRYVTRSHAK